MNLGKLILWGCLVGWASGCTGPKVAETRYTVYFPDVKLQPGEYVQHVQLNVTCGNVVDVNQFLPDWNTKIFWNEASRQLVVLEARHCADSFNRLPELDGLVTFTKDRCDFKVNAVLTTQSTNSTGNCERNITLAQSDLILKKQR